MSEHRTFWINAGRGDYSPWTIDIIRADMRRAIDSRGYPAPKEAYVLAHEVLPDELMNCFIAIYLAAAEGQPSAEIARRAQNAVTVAKDLHWQPLREAQAAYHERLRKHNERVKAYHEWREKRLNRGVCSAFAECPSKRCDCYDCWWDRVGKKKFDE